MVLALSSCTTRSGSPSTPSISATPRTVVTVFEPFTPAGVLNTDISVVSTRSGRCWTTSEVSRRSDTYRCMEHNFILDPCFSDPDVLRPLVACVASTPTDLHKLLVLRLTQPLPSRAGQGASASPAGLPIVVVLADGTRCNPDQGTHAVIAGMTANFHCTNGASLIGAVHRSQPEWTVLTTTPGSSDISKVTIARVYV